MEQLKSIHVDRLSVSYHQTNALDNINLTLPSSSLIGVIGPNGAGKSTFIKALMGMIPTKNANIRIFSQPVNQVRKRIAYVPQRNDIDMDFPILVQDVVVMGRYPHLNWFSRPGKKDRGLAHDALEKVGMSGFSKRQIGELSGGQQQRVFLARALAQEADLFMLDEPFAGIDVRSEEIIVELLKSLQKEGKTIVVVHHDLSKVTEYFDHLVILNQSLIASGKTEEVFTIKNLERAYEGKISFLSGSYEETMVVGN